MTIDEAIQHCEITAKSNEKLAEFYYNKDPGKNQKSGDACQECAAKYRQLAEWLKDYKRLKEQELSEDWYDTPSGEMTLEQARQAVRELRKYVVDNHILSKSEDAISRQYLIDKAVSWDKHYADSERYVSLLDIQNAPSVNPQPKTGRWIYKQYDGYPECGDYHCSECDKIDNHIPAYCPYCGCAMIDPQESEG